MEYLIYAGILALCSIGGSVIVGRCISYSNGDDIQ